MKRLICFACAMSAAAGALQGGSVEGTLTDPEGRPVAGAVVSVRRAFDPKAPLARYSANQFAGAGGSFSFTDVPAGLYHICAQLPGSDLLDPCTWTPAGGQPLDVPEDGTVNAGKVALRRGKRLRIRFDDSAKLLRKHNRKEEGADLVVQVALPSGFFAPAPQITDADDGSREHEIAVPAGMPVKLFVASEFFDIEDAEGAAVDRRNGKRMDISIPGTDAGALVRMKVTGARKK